MSGFVRLNGLDEVPERLKGGFVAIGNFDGMHRGHQQVFSVLMSRARALGAPALALTFEPHPRDVFAPAPFMFRLTDAGAKARLAEAIGLDGLVVMPFSRAFSEIEAGEFVRRLLVEALGVRGVVVGADFRFGRNRAGTPALLRSAGREHGFSVEILELVGDAGPNDETISSSRIRAALAKGDLTTANGLLGYHWFVSGPVIAGDRRGRELGFPTANIAVPAAFVLSQGVYAVRVLLDDGRPLDGIASFGKPMFGDTPPPFETFIFDFDEEIYGRPLSAALVAHIREQQVFADLQALVAAMRADTDRARAALAEARPLSELDRRLGFFG